MLIATLLLLGVPLIIVVAFAVLIVRRKRWLKRQPGVFAGAIRVSSGDVDGLKPKWKHGSGRWVSDVLVWSNAPLLLRSELLPIDARSGERAPKPGEVKRLGDQPIAIEFVTDGARVEVAAKGEQRALITGPSVDTPAPATNGRDRQAAIGSGL
jgi:hypothetical protein